MMFLCSMWIFAGTHLFSIPPKKSPPATEYFVIEELLPNEARGGDLGRLDFWDSCLKTNISYRIHENGIFTYIY